MRPAEGEKKILIVNQMKRIRFSTFLRKRGYCFNFLWKSNKIYYIYMSILVPTHCLPIFNILQWLGRQRNLHKQRTNRTQKRFHKTENAMAPDLIAVTNNCYIHRVLSLQSDFTNEKPMIQQYIESQGHICKFLPKFHCELNAIEMTRRYGKYSEFFLS